MSIHGGHVPYLQRIESPSNADGATGSASQDFRNFLRQPEDGERFTLNGRLEQHSPEENTDLLARLANRIRYADTWKSSTPLAGAALCWENPGIPAGYTYFAQLVAHDLVQSTLAAPALDKLAGTFRNRRTCELDLDTLYGSGPTGCPHAYAIDSRSDLSRYRLRLSRMRRPKEEDPPAVPPFRDIGRGRVCHGNDKPRNGVTDPLIADPRNDDNANLSQLLTIFIHLHNAIMAALAANEPQPAHWSAARWKEVQFRTARQIAAAVYRRIVRSDLLPRILEPGVLAAYDGRDAGLLGDRDPRMPLEFSHAAFRFGHAMVRNSYRLFADAPDTMPIIDILERTSARAPWSMPHNRAWIIQWSMFFDLGNGLAASPSRRIGPSIAHKLQVDEALGDNAAEPINLAHRDLLRGAGMGLWSVPALINALKASGPTELADILPDYSEGAAYMRQWLDEHCRPGAGTILTLDDDEIGAIAADPPLWFYLLCEAAAPGCDGRHLGPLGSLIVAETLWPLSAPTAEDRDIEALEAEILGPDPIASMPDLIKKVAELAGLTNAWPKFL